MSFFKGVGALPTYLCGILLLFAGFACTRQEHQHESALAIRYCQGCHLMPEPQLLDKNTWAFEVLPQMAARLGFSVVGVKPSKIQMLKNAHLFPDTTLLNKEEWEELKAYFISLAPPTTLPGPKVLPVKTDMEDFQIERPDLIGSGPLVTLVHFDEENGHVFVGNDSDNSLSVLDPEGNVREKIKLGGAPSALVVREEGCYVLTMGKVMPHDKKSGHLVFIPREGGNIFGEAETLIDDLQRPVHASMADLDQDGKEDMVIASFGYFRGELAWYSDVSSADRQKHLLRPLPGAIKTEIIDPDGDGDPDIMALMGQGDEGFFLYENDGKGNFEEKRIMQFPPSQGSTYFKWQDLDGDGLEDILYVNGDNGDYPPIVKKFHGIHFFKNMGNMKFEEVLFLEHHGAFKANAGDFDGDGDLDLAAISYFPDYENRPEESFLYYENKGNFKYRASTFEQQPSGKWLTMDSGDMDGDGDQDIILGAAFFMLNDVSSNLVRSWRNRPTPLLILRNERE